jgi:hypothetical protein
MTVAPQGELTLRVNKLASWHLPVAAVTGPGQPLVSSRTQEIAACDSIPWPGPTVLSQVAAYPSRAALCRGLDACAAQARSWR